MDGSDRGFRQAGGRSERRSGTGFETVPEASGRLANFAPLHNGNGAAKPFISS